MLITPFSNAHNTSDTDQTKPLAKTIGGIVICSGAMLYGTYVGPFIFLFGVIDGFDSQIIIGPLITTASLPIFYFGYKLLKSGITNLEELEKQGVSNPIKKITNFIQKKEIAIQKKYFAAK